LVVVVVVAGDLVVVVVDVVVTGWPDGFRGPVVVVATVVVVLGATVVVVVGATVVVVVSATVVVVVGAHLPGGHHDEPWPQPQLLLLPPKRAPWVGQPQPGSFGSIVAAVVGAVVGAAVVVTGSGVVVVTGAVGVVTGTVVLAVGGLETVVFVAPLPPHVLPGFPLKPQPSLGPGLYWAANRAPSEAPTATVPPRLPCPQATAQASASAHHMPVANTSSTATQRRGWALEIIPAVVTSPVRSYNAFRPPARYFGVRGWALRRPGRGRKPREYVTFSPYRYRQSAKILNF
jgi:hypothetical protein